MTIAVVIGQLYVGLGYREMSDTIKNSVAARFCRGSRSQLEPRPFNLNY